MVMSKIIATIEVDDSIDFADMCYKIQEALERLSFVASVETKDGG